ncbi:MAG: response regulator transcription factor [Halanaerobiaceae bacterium]|nr:response regulator transcription factor [Halanaerobiaceae bacterium]
MRILIADDHPLYAEGLRNFMNSKDFEIVGTATDGKTAVELALKEKPDIILMDIAMPVINGIEAIRIIKEKLNDVKIIVLTSFEERDSLINAIRAGALGYLLKTINGEELVRNLKEVKRGNKPYSPEIKK